MAGQAARISMSALVDVRNIQARGVGRAGRRLVAASARKLTSHAAPCSHLSLAHAVLQYAGVELAIHGRPVLFPPQNYSCEWHCGRKADAAAAPPPRRDGLPCRSHRLPPSLPCLTQPPRSCPR